MPNTPTSHEVDGLVEQWFFESFHGSVVARSTEVWNAVHAAKEKLKPRLAMFLAAPAEKDRQQTEEDHPHV